MSSLQVMFEVPDVIEAGMQSGILERVGGVVRHAQSKEIVMWLRDGASITTSQNPVAPFLGALSRLNPALLVAHIALTAVTFERTLTMLQTLNAQMQQLEAAVKQEFQYERDLGLRVALEQARDAFSGSTVEFRHAAANDAKNALQKALTYLLDELERQFQSPSPNPVLITNVFNRALLAHANYLNCLLFMDEIELARVRAEERLPQLCDAAQRLVQLWLGDHQALYFHAQVPLETLMRFLAVRQWLTDPDGETELQSVTIIDVINAVRGEFWSEALVQDDYDHVLNQIARRPKQTFRKRLETLHTNLENAETVIENYNRARGWALEIRAMRLSYREWATLVETDALGSNETAYIVDAAILQKLLS